MYLFNIYICSDYIELTTEDNNLYCSGNFGNNNQTPIHQNSGNQQPNIPPGNNNPHHGFFHNNSSDDDNTLPHDTEHARESLRQCMAKKLNEHRVACAEKGSYDRGWDGADSRLDDKFSDPEHEYICDQVMQYKERVPNSTFHKNVTGVYPDRKYTGLISMRFVDRVFGPR